MSGLLNVNMTKNKAMKAIFSIVGVLFFINVNAQKFDCSSKIKEYKDFFQAKKISEALSSWNEVKVNCPKESEVMYKDGIEILEYKIPLMHQKKRNWCATK